MSALFVLAIGAMLGMHAARAGAVEVQAQHSFPENVVFSSPARTDYTLDNAGQRTAEATKDPLGQLQRQLSRVMDALGRVQQATGRE